MRCTCSTCSAFESVITKKAKWYKGPPDNPLPNPQEKKAGPIPEPAPPVAAGEAKERGDNE